MSKLVFFDIDGTLWDNKMQIPESTIEAIRALRASGHKAFICSGRSRSNIITPKLWNIGFDGVVAGCGTYIELDGQVLFNYLLEEEQIKRVINVFEKAKLPFVLEGPEDHWVDVNNFNNNPFIDYIMKELGDHAHPFTGYEEGLKFGKFSGDITPDTDMELIVKELSEDFDLLIHEQVVVEAVPRGFSKATGIKWLCDYLGLSIDDTYAIGDSINDVDMLKGAGHGIAMGNATEPAIQAAEYQTTDIWQDGIKNALIHYGLIGNK